MPPPATGPASPPGRLHPARDPGPAPVLVACHLGMRYGGIRALDDVGLDLVPGEIHGLCGENGAGKSTFIKILGGFVTPTAGEIAVEGVPLRLGHPTDPRKVSIVHQELAVVPTLSVLDNILLGSPGGFLYRRRAHRDEVRANLDAVGLGHVRLDAPAGNLGLAERQLVEIARGVSRRAKVLLLDEPTATLSDAEIARVFEAARRLRDRGTALVFVSHRLDEVFALTDRVTVLRNGKHVLTARTPDLTNKDLVRAMLGRELVHAPVGTPPAQAASPPRLSLRGYAVPGRLAGVDLELQPGEIIAVVGQLGSGAEALVEALAGLPGPAGGEAWLDGEPLRPGGIRGAMRDGIAYVAEDRAGKGVFLDAPVSTNLTASVMDRFNRGGVMRRGAELTRARELGGMFQIDEHRLGSEVSTLSGGNQQKVSLGKAAALAPRLLLLNEPTRGVDIGARSEIYATLRRMVEQGLAVVFYSTDLEEILELADRVMTVFRGRPVRCVPRSDTTGDDILHDILSGRPEQKAA